MILRLQANIEAAEFAGKFMAEKRNTLEIFLCLRDYADWLGLRNLYVAFIEIMDRKSRNY
jgi:hypothetical protein